MVRQMNRMTDMTRVVRAYCNYAVGLLIATLLLGIWIRAVFLWPQLRLGMSFSHLVHAHSHAAFFGWVVMALCAVIVARTRIAARRRALWLHAHAVGLASVAALLAFAWQGYGAVSIAISVLHVVLWAIFAGLVWPLEQAAQSERRFFRGALVFLLLAGAATVLPGVLMAQGVQSGWLRELGIKLFLTPFIFGWLALGAVAVAYRWIERPRFAAPALWLISLGVLPSTLLFVAAPPPADWLLVVGQVGSLLLGIGTLLFAADALAGTRALLLRGAGAAALATGTLQVLAGFGVGASLMHSRPVVIAFLHLVLLGFATPPLLVGLYPHLRARGWAVTYFAGLALMLTALVGMGWPQLLALLSGAGVSILHLLQLALLGGAVNVLAMLVLIGRGIRVRPLVRSAGALGVPASVKLSTTPPPVAGGVESLAPDLVNR